MLLALLIDSQCYKIILYLEGDYCTGKLDNDCSVSIWTLLSSANSINLI